MRLVKIGLASVNNTVGAVRDNVDRALRIAWEMTADGVTLGVFQEQLIGGYPPEDLVQWQGFVDAQWEQLLRFAEGTRTHPTGYVLGVGVIQNGLSYNAAAVVAGGRVVGLVPKEKLPTYNVFYEGRTFARGFPFQREEHRGVPFGDLLFRFDFGVVAPEVCEDIWSPAGPMARRAFSGAELVANVPASPFRLGALQTRRELIATRANDHQVTVAYANAVGANDGLIFDGGGFVNQNGKWVRDAPRFEEGFATAVVDLDRTHRLRSEGTTWRQDRELYGASNPEVPILDVPKSLLETDRSALAYPAPEHGSFFLPSPVPRARPGSSSARSCSTRSRSAWATTSRRRAPSGCSASPCRGGGTRC